jgi:hypothetical protein
MAKAPVPGAVKTRLVPPLTEEQAAELYQALLLDQLEHLSALDDAELYVAFTPDEAAGLIESLAPAGFHCFPQHGDDLGARMHEVFAELRRRGHRNSVIIGSDLPPVPLAILRAAFAQLTPMEKHVVLGPSRDGGYYLVGMNQPIPGIFAGMTWSHDRVLAQTTEKLADMGIAFGLLPAWFDIDTIADIERLGAIGDPAVRGAMKRTLAVLQLSKP